MAGKNTLPSRAGRVYCAYVAMLYQSSPRASCYRDPTNEGICSQACGDARPGEGIADQGGHSHSVWTKAGEGLSVTYHSMGTNPGVGEA